MKSHLRILSILLVIAFGLAACTPVAAPAPQSPSATIDVNPIYTAAAQTIAVESTRNAALIPTATEVVLPTATEAPTATATSAEVVFLDQANTPTMWIPVSGDSHPSITAKENTNCRQGPDPIFEVVTGFMAGEKSEVFGRSYGGGWWYIKNPTSDDPKYCWVWTSTTEVSGDTSNVQVLVIPTPVKSLPETSITFSVSPAESGTCPQTFTFTASITTDRASDFNYVVLDDDDKTLDSGIVSFSDDGTKTISFTKKYSDTMEKWAQFRITSPNGGKSAKVAYTLDCP
jgi:hypothetical protein